jgi:hypothetical protein
MRRSGLAGRVTRLEATDAAACPDCRPQYRWVCSPEEEPGPGELAALQANACATCGQPVRLYIVRWQTPEEKGAQQ